MAVAFIEPTECVLSPEVCNVGKTTARKSPEYLVLVFLEGCKNLTEVQTKNSKISP